MVNNPLIRPYLLGAVALGGGTFRLPLRYIHNWEILGSINYIKKAPRLLITARLILKRVEDDYNEGWRCSQNFHGETDQPDLQEIGKTFGFSKTITKIISLC